MCRLPGPMRLLDGSEPRSTPLSRFAKSAFSWLIVALLVIPYWLALGFVFALFWLEKRIAAAARA